MALNDLTPRLRTSSTKQEIWVGFFIFLALCIFLSFIGYYAYAAAVKKGWSKKKAPYITFLSDVNGLNVGDSVVLMGFPAGVITKITPNAPSDFFNITVEFEVWEPYYGYIWTDSDVQLKSGLLGGNSLVIAKGGQSGIYDGLSSTYREKDGDFYVWKLTDSKDWTKGGNWSEKPLQQGESGYYLVCNEGNNVMKAADTLISQVSDSLPGVMSLTNQFIGLLNQTTTLLSNVNGTVSALDSIVKNAESITTILTNKNGGLGDWAVPASMNREITQTIGSVRGTVQTTETNLVLLADNLNQSLNNLAEITGNLRQQVEANSFMLSSISTLILDLDDMVQGLKRNWFLKGSFGPQPEVKPESIIQPTLMDANR